MGQFSVEILAPEGHFSVALNSQGIALQPEVITPQLLRQTSPRDAHNATVPECASIPWSVIET